jgi:hypothetical protein
MNTLEVAKYRFTCVVKNPGRHKSFLGETVRSAFGKAIKPDKGCSPDEKSCSTCVNRKLCPYVAVFKPSLVYGPAEGSSETQLPQPFAIGCTSTSSYEAVHDYRVQESFVVDLSLVGSMANYYAAHAINAMVLALDKDFAGCDLLKIEQVNNVLRNKLVFKEDVFMDGIGTVTWSDDEITSTATAANVILKSPLYLIVNSRCVHEPSLEQLTAALEHRARILVDNFSPSLYHRRSLDPAFTADAVKLDMRVVGKSKHSLKKDARPGIEGMLRISGDLSSLIPFLELSAMANLGKHATVGCGSVEISYS